MKHLPAFFAVLLLCSCESAPRFAPLPIETSRPTRSLPVEEWTSTSQPIGQIPSLEVPSFVCLKVGADGKILSPPLQSGQSMESYQDALVCLVALSAAEDYEQMLVQLRSGSETSLLYEGPLPIKDKQRREQLVWIAGREWRELVAEKKLFSLEVLIPCVEDEDGMGCELALSQSFEVSPIPPETRVEPKKLKGLGPKVSALRCGSADDFGYWDAELPKDSPLTESFFCEFSAENPGDAPLENVSLELRGGVSKGSVKPLASQLFPVIAPKEKVSYLFQASVALSKDGPYVLSAAAGRNAPERDSSQQLLPLKIQLIAASLPSSQPAAP